MIENSHLNFLLNVKNYHFCNSCFLKCLFSTFDKKAMMLSQATVSSSQKDVDYSSYFLSLASLVVSTGKIQCVGFWHVEQIKFSPKIQILNSQWSRSVTALQSCCVTRGRGWMGSLHSEACSYFYPFTRPALGQRN